MTKPNNDYRSFFENAPIGFWRTNIEDGQFLMANLACANIFNYPTVEDFLKVKSTDLYLNGGRQHLLDELNANGCVKNMEVQMVRQDGAPVWVSITARCEKDLGYIEGSVVEITHEKELADQVHAYRKAEVERLSEIQKGIKKKLRDISLSCESRTVSSRK